MIVITKDEMKFLTNKGVKFHDGGINVTHSKHSGKTYYLVESKKNLQKLNNYRQKIICK